ncbi:hypothetical protein B484DRAFT_398783 [Ochromonadaceae sp. CCMP2298]|nr:hypothetical protein B484DRAFT_398783 [Ochromonadaceae sp. CCMP2298]
MDAAIKAVGEFHFQAEALDRDLADLDAAGGDLVEMLRRRIALRHPARLNPDRVHQCISDGNPERELLLELATHGVDARRVLSAEFTPNGDTPAGWPQQTPTYRKASDLVNSLLSKTFHVPGLAVILPRSRVRDIPGCNVSTSSWATKSGGNNNGRPTFNPRCLNLPATKLNADKAWGVVNHPRASNIVSMIVRYASECHPQGYTWEDLRLWKIDLNGAYTLEDNAAPACKLLMTELTDSALRETLIFIYTCGSFGTNYQPAAFDVIMRASRHELQSLLQGFIDAYTDDFYGIALAHLLRQEVGVVKKFFRTLLGEDAIAEHKCFDGQRLVVIDWDFDLLAQHVNLSEACLDKSLHGFMSVNEFLPMEIKVLQRLASWGIRYGMIYPLMGPFTSALYNELRGKTNMHCKLTLSPVSRMAVLMLHTLTLLIGVDEPQFARSFDSWERPTARTGLIAQCDGSLAGGGILFLAASADGTERSVGLAAVDLRTLGFGDDSGFQNTVEYISMTAASRDAVELRRQGLLIDNKPISGV